VQSGLHGGIQRGEWLSASVVQRWDSVKLCGVRAGQLHSSVTVDDKRVADKRIADKRVADKRVADTRQSQQLPCQWHFGTRCELYGAVQ
jgi:hypothetical protein